MEGVAQLAEHKVVALGVAGSSPVTLPFLKSANNWNCCSFSEKMRLFQIG